MERVSRRYAEGGELDASRFDRLSKSVAGANTRRSLVQIGAALILAGVPVLQQDEANARRRSNGNEVRTEHFRHKKRWYCLNGESIRRYRRKQERLLAQGATLGKCGDAPCVPVTCADLGAVCGPADDGCGGSLECGTCVDEETCCSGQCVQTDTDENNCGDCGVVCVGGEICIIGECSIG
jgi:hypothetical protein